MRLRPAAALAVAATLATACAVRVDVPRNHIVMFDGEGEPVDPATPTLRLAPKRIDRDAYAVHLDAVAAALRRHGAEADAAGRAKRALIFVHGGLNDYRRSLSRAIELTPAMLADGIYPIFINWDSSFQSSYVDHLLFVRQGRNWGWRGAWLVPMPLAGDLVGAVARAPLVWWSSFNNALRRLPGAITPEEILLENRLGEELADFARRFGLDLGGDQPPAETLIAAQDLHTAEIDAGRDFRSWPEVALRETQWLVTLPAQFLLGPFLNSFGASAWDIMRRRVFLLFHTERDWVEGSLGPFAGGVPQLIRALRAIQDEDPSWEFVLAGHSMGTMVVSGILGLPEPPDFSHVVYMAAADSIESTASNLNRYMRARAQTRCHILTLHEDAELGETMYLGIPPHGSLLVWIDEFLDEPLTPLGATSGRFGQALLMRGVLEPHVLERCNIRAFSVGQGAPPDDPRIHGDFGMRPFWRDSFWLPAGQ